eukprot:TRINITY_DN71682_c0_g1_i1.p1 TRINITY_DN71682_c0_g1~~TRINITY_DN71682_c0_g1_i1.p1  ORF type:complete len:605 (+),score=142.08 TRINITY_DN71682_c0_g1_i1:116-1930(+)
MAAGSHEWRIDGWRQKVTQGGCLYGPEFSVGSARFQLHLYPRLNDWPHGEALFLVLLAAPDAEAPRAEVLCVEASFDVPELHFAGSACVKATTSRWSCGFGPEAASGFAGLLGAYAGDALTLRVNVDVVEAVCSASSLVRWTCADFEELRYSLRGGSSASAGGYHQRLGRSFEVQDERFGVLGFRLDLHPVIDASGNFHVSFRLERAAPEVGALELNYELEFEQLPFRAASPPLRGTRADWTCALGIAGQPTDCALLRNHTGPLTIRLKVSVSSCDLEELPSAPAAWEDFVGTDFRYMLLSAAGSDVAGLSELPVNEAEKMDFARACSWNVHMMRDFLLERGVPAARIAVADYDGAAERTHPRDLLEAFLASSDGAPRLVVYFCGNACEDGSWCLRWRPPGQRYASDVRLPPCELLQWKEAVQTTLSRAPLDIIVEANSAGAWCLAAKAARLQGRVLAACAAGSCARARRDGSLFTDWLIGRSDELRASPEVQVPMEYSRLGSVQPLPLVPRCAAAAATAATAAAAGAEEKPLSLSGSFATTARSSPSPAPWASSAKGRSPSPASTAAGRSLFSASPSPQPTWPVSHPFAPATPVLAAGRRYGS